MVTLRTGAPQSRVIMGVHGLHGELRWLSVNSRPLGIESGTPQAVLVTFLDVTENRQAEERLRASELQLRTRVTERRHAEEERDRFFELSMDILCTAKMDGYFKTVNPAFSATVGFSSEESPLHHKRWLANFDTSSATRT